MKQKFINKKDKFSKFAKIYAIILIIASIYYALLSVGCLIILIIWNNKYSQLAQARGITLEDIKYYFYCFVITFIYCLIGGIGLYKFKKWSLYLISVVGIYFLFFAILNTFIFFDIKYMPILVVVNGLASVYLIRNRHYFDKK